MIKEIRKNEADCVDSEKIPNKKILLKMQNREDTAKAVPSLLFVNWWFNFYPMLW
jgi:hypothetical protein